MKFKGHFLNEKYKIWKIFLVIKKILNLIKIL